MFLTQHEQERLLIHVAADVARRRRERGLRLDHPEAVAIIPAFLLEGARDGRTVADLMSAGRTVLTREDVLDGVPEMVAEVQVEATFPDGTSSSPSTSRSPRDARGSSTANRPRCIARASPAVATGRRAMIPARSSTVTDRSRSTRAGR